MLKFLRRGAPMVLAVVASLLFFQGCDRAPEPEALIDSSSLFDHVPADTPYVYGSVRRPPEAFVEKMFQIYGDMRELYKVSFDQARRDYANLREQAREAARQAGREPPPDPFGAAIDDAGLERLIAAVTAEFDGKMTPEGLRELGFRSDATGVMYGLGVLPVARVELSDAAKVDALIRRIERNSGLTGDWRRHGEVEYLRIGDARVALVLGTVGEQLVVALVPAKLEERYLPHLFGDQRPANSLADSGTHAELIETYGFTGFGEGYLDLRGIARLLSGRAEGEAAEALAALETELPSPSPNCARLIDTLAAGSPRLVMGITRLDERAVAARSVLETSPAVAELLQGLSEPVPGMGRRSDAQFSFGMGMNIPGLRAALRTLGKQVLANGEGCEWVEPGEIRQQMAQLDLAFGPMTAMFKGVFVEALELQIDPDTLQPDVERLKLRALAQVDDPGGVFAMIGMFNPALAQLEVPRDGTPVQVPAEMLPPGVPDLYVGIQDKSLVLASGVDGAGMIGELFDSAIPEQPPLLAMSYDMQALAPLVRIGMEQQVALLQSEGAEPEAVEAMRTQGDAALKMYENYGQTRLSVLADRRGLIFDTETEFK